MIAPASSIRIGRHDRLAPTSRSVKISTATGHRRTVPPPRVGIGLRVIARASAAERRAGGDRMNIDDTHRVAHARRLVTAAICAGALVAICGGAAMATTVPPDGASPDAVLTLRIGTDDAPGRPAAAQITEFARSVAERSEGAIVVEPVWEAVGAGDTPGPDWDQQVARLVTSGELEMGLIPSRAWDTEGVTTLRALNTPFLVTSEELVNQIVSGDLAGELMSGLDAAGVVGLALFPEGFRHPFAYGDPLFGPDDYEGAVMRAPTSATVAAMFEALGATTTDDPYDSATQTGAESSHWVDLPGTATGNVTFFPKVNSLVVNAAVWAGLNEAQQAILTGAAAATRDWSIDEIPSDHDDAVARCEDGFAIALASDDDLAALVEATAPVVTDLREDPTTARLIDEITALRDAQPPMAIEPVACA
jgi:TRAP-type C4-dicarboxylate transport system substrate-binding protein